MNGLPPLLEGCACAALQEITDEQSVLLPHESKILHAPRCEPLENGVLLAPLVQHGRADPPLAKADFEMILKNHHEPIGILERQWPQQDGVHETENGRVRPDAERERQHSHGGEAGVLQQLAEGEFEIVHGLMSVLGR
jgi:hypothetical protein